MKKNQGFTLIELLAVIVILAVIALITTPQILNVIEKTKKSAFESSVKGIENSIDLDMINNDEVVSNYKVENGIITNTGTNDIISTKGGTNINGSIKVKKDKTMIYALNNGKNCIIKRDGQDKTEHISDVKFCTMDVATNLVVNGYGEYGDNTNFNKLTFEDGAFMVSGDKQKEISSDQYIKVDTNKKYDYSVEAKNNGTDAVYFSGLHQFDYDKGKIQVVTVSHVKDTLTTLTKDLKNGDTVVYFSDLSHSSWKSNNSASFELGLIFWNYKNSSDYVYPSETYSRNFYYDLYTYDAINQTNNTITLKKAWSRGTMEAGTKVSRSASNGASFNYGLFESKKLTTEYQIFSNTLIGIKDYAMHHKYFSSATEYIKWVTFENYYNNPNTITSYKNIVIREIVE